MRPSLAIVVSAVVLGQVAAQSSPTNVMFALQPEGTADVGGCTPAGHEARAAALGDLDGDGQLDALIALLDGPDELWLGDGSGALQLDAQSVLARDPGPSHDVELGDLDGDGLLDAVIALGPGHANHVYVHVDGGAALVRLADCAPANALTDDRDDSWGVALGDLDADGRLDVVVANLGQPNAVYANTTSGGVTSFRRLDGELLRRDVGDSYAVEIDDIDADGDVDIVIANRDDDDFVYLARGESEFDFMKITVGSGGNPVVADDEAPGRPLWERCLGALLGPWSGALLPPSVAAQQPLGLGGQGLQVGVLDVQQ